MRINLEIVNKLVRMSNDAQWEQKGLFFENQWRCMEQLINVSSPTASLASNVQKVFAKLPTHGNLPFSNQETNKKDWSINRKGTFDSSDEENQMLQSATTSKLMKNKAMQFILPSVEASAASKANLNKEPYISSNEDQESENEVRIKEIQPICANCNLYESLNKRDLMKWLSCKETNNLSIDAQRKLAMMRNNYIKSSGGLVCVVCITDKMRVCTNELGDPTPVSQFAVYWDIENCQVPKADLTKHVVNKIRKSFLSIDQKEVEIVVACNSWYQNPMTIKLLSEAGVSVLHAPPQKKNAADMLLSRAIKRFASVAQHNTNTTVVLITGDIDFYSDIK